MGRLRRLYVPELPAAGGGLTLPPESLEHARVLRLREGDRVELFDGGGRSAEAQIERVTRREIACVVAPTTAAAVPSSSVRLIVCLPKAGKLETIVRMTTELGVAAIHLAVSERSVPKVGAGWGKLARLRRVAREACAQCGRAYVPTVCDPQPLAEVAAAADGGAIKLAFWEESTAPLPAAHGGEWAGREIWAVVGPEGGISAAEAQSLQGLGYALVGLGQHILRADTACVVISALLVERSGGLRQ